MELNLLHYTFTGDVENDGKVIGGGSVEESEGGSGGNVGGEGWSGCNVGGEGDSGGSGGNVGGERGSGGSGGNVCGEGGERTEGGREGAGGRGRGRYKNSKSSILTLLYLYNICVHLQNISTIIVFNTEQICFFTSNGDAKRWENCPFSHKLKFMTLLSLYSFIANISFLLLFVNYFIFSSRERK